LDAQRVSHSVCPRRARLNAEASTEIGTSTRLIRQPIGAAARRAPPGLEGRGRGVLPRRGAPPDMGRGLRGAPPNIGRGLRGGMI